MAVPADEELDMTDYNTPENHAAFCKAMAAAQGEIENVAKTSVNPHFKSKYAGLDAIREATHKILAKHGLWTRTRLITNGGSLAAALTVGHADGYEDEETVFALPVTGNAQAYGSAATYARRYQLSAYFNLASEGEDDDGEAASRGQNGRAAPGASGPISAAQAEEIKMDIIHSGADLPRFLKTFGIEKVEEMPAARFAEAKHKLELKLAQTLAEEGSDA
jgi:hypothetical protein